QATEFPGRSFNAAPRGCQGQIMQSKVQSPKSKVLNSVREERTRHFIPGLPSPERGLSSPSPPSYTRARFICVPRRVSYRMLLRTGKSALRPGSMTLDFGLWTLDFL